MRDGGLRPTRTWHGPRAHVHPRDPYPPLAHVHSALEAELDDNRASRYNQEEILDALPAVLRQEVVLYTNSVLLSRLPSLARQQPDVQAFIVEHLRRQTVRASWATYGIAATWATLRQLSLRA